MSEQGADEQSETMARVLAVGYALGRVVSKKWIKLARSTNV